MKKLKCKYCDWKTDEALTELGGKHITGETRLRKHVAQSHPNQFARIQQWLRDGDFSVGGGDTATNDARTRK